MLKLDVCVVNLNEIFGQNCLRKIVGRRRSHTRGFVSTCTCNAVQCIACTRGLHTDIRNVGSVCLPVCRSKPWCSHTNKMCVFWNFGQETGKIAANHTHVVRAGSSMHGHAINWIMTARDVQPQNWNAQHAATESAVNCMLLIRHAHAVQCIACTRGLHTKIRNVGSVCSKQTWCSHTNKMCVFWNFGQETGKIAANHTHVVGQAACTAMQ
jgi:hypothetical protein